ncbi:MAG TPA: HD domain-containing phosphohydrolase [Solirubrobacteraceae bacterium]|jgi:HD-GYP domain-containing protein (c-di-GMP phosphodiesterase class II)|nr:HD domain-containing phosphohydrolase [Solirubrobacteraceae bacterium]
MTTTHESQLAALLDRAPAEAVREPMARKAIGRAVRELVGALRNHHTGTAEHSNRLASQCRLVGEQLDLAADVVFELELVAILHDIGKLAVPAHILDLARPLNARERAVVRSHTIRGAEILAEIAGLAHLAPLVRSSHERWDGTGYPDRLAGPRIPLAARVVFTVDSYDAMTNDRPYRRALAREEARRRIAAASGSAFDPHVVRALLAAFF